jgi:N-acylneuraminate cytidylyltransferase
MRVAIIPSRGGSRRIPGKNIRIFHGKPIIAYSIEAALRSSLFDEVFVSTDSDEIACVSEKYDAQVLMRSAALAADAIGTQTLITHHMNFFFSQLESDTLVCCIYATAPLMSVLDLELGRNMLKSEDAFDYAFSVNVDPLFDAGQFYWGTAFAYLHARPLISTRTCMVPIAANRVCDINTPKDWARAEQMYLELQKEGM